MWDVIVLIHDHCPSIYFSCVFFRYANHSQNWLYAVCVSDSEAFAQSSMHKKWILISNQSVLSQTCPLYYVTEILPQRE